MGKKREKHEKQVRWAQKPCEIRIDIIKIKQNKNKEKDRRERLQRNFPYL